MVSFGGTGTNITTPILVALYEEPEDKLTEEFLKVNEQCIL